MRHYRHKAPFDHEHLVALDIETVSGEEMPDGAFPPWPTHSPIVASMLIADRYTFGEWEFALESVLFTEDDAPLERIDDLLRGRSVITFNGSGFDFRVLMLAAQRRRSFRLRALTAAATQPRFGNLHYDLAEKYSAYGAARGGGSLERLCEALDIPAKRTTHGNDVGRLFDEGKIDEIVAYCETDVAATMLLFAHCRATEIGDPGYHASLTYQFVRWAQLQGSDHLNPFTKVHDLDELLRQSLIGQIDAAVVNAGRNADLRAKQALDKLFNEAETIHY
jgi:hypothetical protein